MRLDLHFPSFINLDTFLVLTFLEGSTVFTEAWLLQGHFRPLQPRLNLSYHNLSNEMKNTPLLTFDIKVN